MSSLKQLKSPLVSLLGNVGGFRLAHWLTRHQPRILMYHRFSAQPQRGFIDVFTLRQQLRQLKQTCNVISLSQLVDGLKKQVALPKNAVVLTVDDGYADFYYYAYPEFKAAGLPVSFFVTTGFVDGKIWLWPDMLSDLLDHIVLPEAIWPESTPADLVKQLAALNTTLKVWRLLNSFLMPLPLSKKLHWLHQAAQLNQYQITEHAPPEYAAVNWLQLQELADSGLVEIGAHTVMHPTLSALPLSQAMAEIRESRERLQQQLTWDIRHFCYPNGQPEDFTPEIVAAVEKLGFDSAVAAHCHYVTLDNRFALPRFSVTSNSFQFNKIVFGVQWLAKRFGQARWQRDDYGSACR